jgi:two-component system sensor histidine kinase KdpD
MSAVISALAWDYYFIPPHFTLKIDKTEDVVMLFMFFIVAVTNGVLTAKLKDKDNKMTEKDRRLNAFYNLVKNLAAANNLDEVLFKAADEVKNVFGFGSIIFFPEDGNKLKRIPHPASNVEPDEIEWLLAEASYKEKTETGKTTPVQNDADTICFPIEINGIVFCVYGFRMNEDFKITQPEKAFLKEYIKEIIPFLEKFSIYSNS